MDKRQQLLKRLDKAWYAFKESYAGLPDSELLEPGVTGAWSVRDIIAHVTTWEEEALKHVPLVLIGKRPPRYSVTYGGIDAFNAQTTRQKENLSLTEVFRQQEEVHHRLIEHPDTYPADEPQRRCPDITKAQLQVGYQPQVGMEDGLRRFFGWAKTAYA